MKTAKEFYKEKGYPELDKFDKKACNFNYYDLLEFAEEYAKALLEEAAEKARLKMLEDQKPTPYEMEDFILSLISKEETK